MWRSEWKSKLSIVSLFLSPFFFQNLLLADTSVTENVPKHLPGEKIKSGQIPGGYNETASYLCENPWKLIFEADYIYWIWQQEMMAVGTLINPVAQGTAAFLNAEAEVVLQSPGYASGFQLGLGCDLKGMDDWIFFGKYTWYQNRDTMRTTSSTPEVFAVSPSVLRHIEGSDPGVLLCNNLYSSATLHFNNADLVLQRPFYFGRKLTANFMVGLLDIFRLERVAPNEQRIPEFN